MSKVNLFQKLDKIEEKMLQDLEQFMGFTNFAEYLNK